MFVTVGFHHHLTAGKESEFLASQQAFSEAMKGLPGFRERHILRDEAGGAVVSLSIWESRDAFIAAGPDLIKYRAEQSRAGRDFSKFQDEPETLYMLEPIHSVRS